MTITNLFITAKTLSGYTCTPFVNVIYNNFIHLSKYPHLKHSKKEILRLLKSKNVILYVAVINNKISGYLLGEVIVLNDGRTVLYITYLYVATKFRKLGIASKLIDAANVYTMDKKINGLMLTCNTHDKYVLNFYTKKGFTIDMLLKTNSQYEVFYL
jgi:ribosomal protein S18 acetylase RimI-like enzyme